MKNMKYIASLLSMIALMAVSAIAGTTDCTIGGTVGYPAKFMGHTVLFERSIDFSSSSYTGLASQVYQLFNVPTNTFIFWVGYDIETGSSGTCTIDVGDGSDTDGYLNDANVLTGQTACAVSVFSIGSTAYNMVTGITYSTVAAGIGGTNVVWSNLTAHTSTVYPITTAPTAYSAGRLYTANDTIDMILNNGTTNLSITIRALGVPVGGLDN